MLPQRRGISTTNRSNVTRLHRIKRIWHQIGVDSMTSGTLPHIRSSFNVAVAIDGVTHEKAPSRHVVCLMNTYVIRVDGRVNYT